MSDRYIPPSRIVANNPDDAKVLSLAQGLYGEFAGVEGDKQKDYMVMGGSAILNSYGKGEWKKNDWDTHIHNRLDAVRYKNQPYQEALRGDFQNDRSKKAWIKAMQVSFGLVNGTIEKTPGQFYWTSSEYKKIAGSPALPNPEKLEKTGKVGKYGVYQYKKRKTKKKSG